jgi:single-strand DNA-binding protein
MNKVFLIGNLTRDPELSTAGGSGVSVCRFGMAVNRRFQNKDGSRETDFFNITAWRDLGENCAKFIKKGSKVAVSGELQIRNYDDKDGNKRTAVDIIAAEVEFLDKRNSSGDDAAEIPNDGGAEMKPVTDDSLPF